LSSSSSAVQTSSTLNPRVSPNTKKEQTPIAHDNAAKSSSSDEGGAPAVTLGTLFRTPTLNVWFAAQILLWFFSCFVYYGLSLGASSISDNLYLNVVLLGGVEMPAYLFACFTIKRYGAKNLTIYSLLVAAACCIYTPFACPAPAAGAFDSSQQQQHQLTAATATITNNVRFSSSASSAVGRTASTTVFNKQEGQMEQLIDAFNGADHDKHNGAYPASNGAYPSSITGMRNGAAMPTASLQRRALGVTSAYASSASLSPWLASSPESSSQLLTFMRQRRHEHRRLVEPSSRVDTRRVVATPAGGTSGSTVSSSGSKPPPTDPYADPFTDHRADLISAELRADNVAVDDAERSCPATLWLGLFGKR
jgi:hypothetical protein